MVQPVEPAVVSFSDRAVPSCADLAACPGKGQHETPLSGIPSAHPLQSRTSAVPAPASNVLVADALRLESSEAACGAEPPVGVKATLSAGSPAPSCWRLQRRYPVARPMISARARANAVSSATCDEKHARIDNAHAPARDGIFKKLPVPRSTRARHRCNHSLDNERTDERGSVPWPSSRFIVLSLAGRGGRGLRSAAQPRSSRSGARRNAAISSERPASQAGRALVQFPCSLSHGW